MSFSMKLNKQLVSSGLQTAVLLLVFNRPDTTIQVFEKIRKIKPHRLYIAADGPRIDKKNDEEKINKVKEIVTNVDWTCKVKTLFRNKNLGCKKAVSEAITWFFENEKQGIILEDDCVPNLDFFKFCENLLDHYSADRRVSVITGNNFQNRKWIGDGTYYFSRYNHCWGWASWRRAWKYYQGDIKFWPKWRNSKDWLSYIHDKVEQRYWQKIFNLTHSKQIDSWAYAWTASVWYKNGLTATPNINLVRNIGFGEHGTHTKSKNSKLSNMATSELGHIMYPKKVKRDIEADRFVFNNIFLGKKLRFYFKLIDIFHNLKSIYEILLFKSRKKI